MTDQVLSRLGIVFAALLMLLAESSRLAATFR